MTTAAGPDSARSLFFKQLKVKCVPLSQLAIRSRDKIAIAKDVLQLLDDIIYIWNDQVLKDSGVVDDKIADYVFFPVAHVLRSQEQYPVRVIERTIRLLARLLEYGWKSKLSADLSQQLLFFLTFIVGHVPGQEQKRELPEETILEGYRTLTVLVQVAGSTPSSPLLTAGEDRVPSLGHCVSVVLDGVADATVPSIQLEALHCIRAVFTVVRNQSLLAGILPGTVSTLAKRLSPPVHVKTQRRVLISCLETLQLVILTVLGDIRVRRILKQIEDSKKDSGAHGAGLREHPSPVSEAGETLTAAWLTATGAQVKIALSSVLRLRSHSSENVQQALNRLCIRLLDECHASLSDCQSILIETTVMLADETRSPLETSILDLARIYPEVGDAIKTTMYSWISGLARVMRSSDDGVKQRAIQSILKGSKLVSALDLDSPTLDFSIGSALRDSLVVLIANVKPLKVLDEDVMESAMAGDVVKSSTDMQVYQPVLLGEEGLKMTRTEIGNLLANIGSADFRTKLASEMASYIYDAKGPDQIVSYWLSFELLKAAQAESCHQNDLVDLSAFADTKYQDAAFQELYDFSASVISSHSDAIEVDWRLEAIALEVVSFTASHMKRDFRPELIDVLYPTTTFLGSQSARLRRHAIVTLESIARYCEYESVSALIIDNVDYMLNSVALRLNTLDITPASTKVLTMMIRLTGPRLVPFLDDVVAAVFAALDNHHGYPVFVESLFVVLFEIVQQGIKSDSLLLQDATSTGMDHRKKPRETMSVASLLDMLERRVARAKMEDEAVEKCTSDRPEKPWPPGKSDAESLLDNLENQDEEAGKQETSAVEPHEPEPTPTYALLTRVTTYTQHYLTSPAPSLRKSLLELIATVSPALGRDENAFLPIVHSIWPVVVSRLRDPEPFVVVAACSALGALCGAAGDFLGSRFRNEWAGGLAKWFAHTREEAARKKPRGGVKSSTSTGYVTDGGTRTAILLPTRGEPAESHLAETSSYPNTGGLGRFAQAAQVWEAAVGLLTAMISYVRIDDAMFDEILELVGDLMPRNEALRQALETVNADAVWLVSYRAAGVTWQVMPMMDGVEFVKVATGSEVVC